LAESIEATSIELPSRRMLPSRANATCALPFDMDYAILIVMATSTDFGTDGPVDGRVQRSERSREAIVRALLELVGEGVLEPTAQQVALRADVGVRTVFRHFSDMDTLFAAMNDRLTDTVSGFFVEESQDGSISDRIEALIERRSKIFGIVEPYRRAQAVQRSRSTFLQKQQEVTNKILRTDLQRWLPEVSSFEDEVAEALELTLSFESWERLRFDQRLGARRAQGVIRRMVLALIAESKS
jgi:AcrR family transcriptional regulator